MGYCSPIGINGNCGFASLEPIDSNCIQDGVLNPYNNYLNNENQQCLYDSLVSESILNRGVELIYIKRDLQDVDLIFGEDPRSKFNTWFKIAVYVESFEGWEGDQDMFTKFGFAINDEMSLAINPNLFMRQTDGLEAKEGDLIYFPSANSLLELTWVEKEYPWYAMGTLPMRKLKAQKFIYSGEEINLETPEQVVDDISDIFTIEEDIERINNIDGMYDIQVPQGSEVEQAREEAEEYFEDRSRIPPGASGGSPALNMTVDLNSLDL